ncbi:hypothetical protein D9M71_606140 [compost metagenome]
MVFRSLQASIGTRNRNTTDHQVIGCCSLIDVAERDSEEHLIDSTVSYSPASPLQVALCGRAHTLSLLTRLIRGWTDPSAAHGLRPSRSSGMRHTANYRESRQELLTWPVEVSTKPWSTPRVTPYWPVGCIRVSTWCGSNWVIQVRRVRSNATSKN